LRIVAKYTGFGSTEAFGRHPLERQSTASGIA
jgi:hypothetical protein